VESSNAEGLVEEHNYGYVIENHYRSGRYWFEDIDRIPFEAYSSDK
jgi:hypothetical protein